MLLSMTGFGKAVKQTPELKITVEVKSLNSKQIDISSRVPGSCRELDLEMRAIISQRLKRGKVDLTVNIEGTAANDSATLDIETMQIYKQQIEQARAALGLPEPADWYATLLRLPDVVRTNSSTGLRPEIRTDILETLNRAIDELISYRRNEGSKLETFFSDRVSQIGELLTTVGPYEIERVTKIRRRIEENLVSLTKIDVDRARLEQEMIFYIEKLDINEEKQRLATHLSYFIDTMNGAEGQGKKLGFIAQEMGREINTLGSKSNHAEMQRIVVKMKDELEQIKEQVLNVL